MVWYNLRIGQYNLKYTPLKAEVKIFPYCDKDGNILKKVLPTNKEKSYFIDDKENKHDTAFRLINDKPFSKLTKTKETDNFKEVDLKEVENLLIEKTYIVDSKFLLNDLKESNKALKFGFTNGNGFKVYLGYIHTSILYPNLLFMSLGISLKSDLIKDIKELMNEKNKAEEITLIINGIDKAKVEDLIQI